MKALCFLIGFSSVLLAAPIPKNLEPKADAIKRLFGDVITDNDVTFDLLRKSVLSASVGTGFKKRAYDWSDKFPVLASKEFNGDFEASVKLTIGFDKQSKLASGFDKRLCCSGLLLNAGSSVTCFVGYSHSYNKKDWQSGLYMLNKTNRGGSSTQMNLTFDEKPFAIRLTRRNSKVTIETAAEGKPYKQFTTYDFVPEEFKISLVHFNTLDSTTTADFEDFVIKPAPEKN